MKKYMNIFYIALIAFFLQGCTSHEPDAGYEVVYVLQPYLFGSGGVSMNECDGTGLYWTAASTTGVMINVKPVKKTETFDDLITKDNNPVDFSITMQLRVKPGDGKNCYSPIMVNNFGVNWYVNKLQQPTREFVRQFTKKRLMFEMTTNGNVTDKLKKELTKFTKEFVKKEKIPVDILTINIGKVSPPKAILEETIATGKQVQRQKTEASRAAAELSRAAAERNKAKADNAYRLEMKMSPSEYINLRKVENQRLLYEKLPDNMNDSNIYIGSMPQPVISKK